MADTTYDSVNESLMESENRLYENIIGDSHKDFFNMINLSTKARIIKDYYRIETERFFDRLNKCLPDVKWRYQWRLRSGALDSEMRHIHTDVYNKDFTCDDVDFNDLYGASNREDYFYNTPLQEIDIKIEYYWERKCSLGCMHSQKRFYIVNMAKLLDLFSWLNNGMPVKTLIKEFIPDFFYDPTIDRPKRGRPRKVVCN